MTVTPHDVLHTRARQRAAAERARAALAASVRARLPGVVEALRAQGARRVWLIGSFAHGDVHEGSDVDLVVEVPSGTAFDPFVVGTIAEAALGREVDLLVLSALPASFQARVWAEGERLDGEHP